MINIQSVTFLVCLILPLSALAEHAEIEPLLAENELNWLESHSSVSFTGDPNWLPYEAFDKNGNYIGIVAEHIELISKLTGLKFNMSPSKTWSESTEKAKTGQVDILSETDDSDLKSHLNFTRPYISNPIVITMHSRENYVENINDIQHLKIALIKDYGYASKIRRKYAHIDFITVDNIQNGLIAISTGKVDALLCTLALCSYTIAELGLNNVKITGKTEFDTKLALGVQKNLPELLSILNKAIDNISRNDKQLILDRWIKAKFPEKTDYTLVYQVIAVAFIIMAMFAIWIRRLSQEINLRIATENELKTAEETSRLSHQRLLLHRKHSPLGVIDWNTKFEVIDWNPAAQHIFGYTKNEMMGQHITKRILPNSALDAVDKVWNELLNNKGGTYSLNENITKDERTILCEWHNTPLIDNDGNVIGVTSLVEDVTERQKDEESRRQTQKMDAVGKLTGGIAHDFNNMLGVILGFSDLLKASTDKDNAKQLKYCNEIIIASERARKLIAQLLDFARKSPSSTEAMNINNLLNGMQHMLEKTLTLRIKLVFDLHDDLWGILLDASRFEDALLNICINSMHAMPDGGTLTLSTSNVHLNDVDYYNNDISPGNYVLLSVEDTGIGMSQETQQKIFDPFFTTKGTEGTGLGLSQVYGVVQQMGVKIRVFSEPGKGTRMMIYIPRMPDNQNIARTAKEVITPEKFPTGTESILVVDDEVALLDLSEETLSDHGYNVYLAQNAEQALETLKSTHIDLLLSDVIMPGMNGYELASKVKKLYPKIKIQMASGYTDDTSTSQEHNELHKQRLHKPFKSGVLLMRIKELLNEEQ